MTTRSVLRRRFRFLVPLLPLIAMLPMSGVPGTHAQGWSTVGATTHGCEATAAQQTAVWRHGYYVNFAANGPPPGNPYETGYLFDRVVSGPIVRGSWSTVVYGPRFGSQNRIPGFHWVAIQGALCGGVLWERQWRPWIPTTGGDNAVPGGEPAAATADLSDYGLSFRYPARWKLYLHGTALTTFSSLIAHLSNVPFDFPDPCSVSHYQCGNPLYKLPRHGVLVTWTEGGMPGWTLARVRGRPLTIDGHAARLSIEHGMSSGCPADTNESIFAAIAGPVQSSWYGMQACIRGPRLERTEQQVLNLLHSVKLTAPADPTEESPSTALSPELRTASAAVP